MFLFEERYENVRAEHSLGTDTLYLWFPMKTLSSFFCFIRKISSIVGLSLLIMCVFNDILSTAASRMLDKNN
jgi:hypothetical protein